MNKGTKIRTITGIVIALNTALMAIDVTGFNNPTVDTIYRALSILFQFLSIAVNTYYNNDYSVEACEGTGLTRQLKAKKAEEYSESGNGEEGSVIDDEM